MNDTTEKNTTPNYYEQATTLLSTPRARLTNKTRKDLHKARIVFASLASSTVETGTDRASRRRIAKGYKPAAQPQGLGVAAEVRSARLMAAKNWKQLNATSQRGNWRSVKLAIKANTENHPQTRQALQHLSFAYATAASAAGIEIKKRSRV